MPAVKIVVIGASRVFAPSIAADLWDARDDLAGSTLALCDIDADGLRVTTRVIQRMIDERGMPYRLESSTERRDLLDGADYVVTAIAIDHRRLWTIDLDIAQRHGLILPTGDTVGAGGWSRALRTVPLFQAIAADVQARCPDAWLLNYTNPMSVICRTLEKTTDLKVVGLCHGIEGTTRRIAEFMHVAVDELSVRAAGINHLQWILDLTRNGEDFYPDFKAAPHPPPEARWDVSWELMNIYGHFPSPGDRHVSEFFPWYSRADANGRLEKGLFRFDLDEYFGRGDSRRAEFAAMAAGAQSLDERLFEPTQEKAIKLVVALAAGRRASYTVNIANRGAIANLQPFANVEVPAWFDASGLQRDPVGSMPEPIAAVLRPWVDQIELLADAIVRRDKQAAMLALLADRTIVDLDAGLAMGRELLEAHAPYLTEYH